VENFPQGQRGRTRDRLAQLVNLGSGRTYSKAAKVVEAIDKETVFGNLQTAQRLRSTLNSKSVDAAYQLLTLTRKRANNPEDNSSHHDNLTPLTQGSEFLLSPQSDRFPNTIRSCWTCQHRDRLIENHSFHCTHLGTLSLIDKDACTRGEECDLWCDRDVEQMTPQSSPKLHLNLSSLKLFL
jgi:ParB family chromosome partitioning protein